jgi:MFS family permease
VSTFGSAVTDLALPLTAVLTLHASPSDLGLLVAAERAPILFVGLVAGWLAGKVVRGTGFGIIGDILVGIAGALIDRYGRKPVIVPGCLISAAAFAGFALANGYPLFVLSAVLWGISGAFTSGSAAYAADQAPPGANGLTMGIYRMLADLGYVVGPILLGLIASAAGAEGSLVFAAALSVLTMLPFLLLAPETGGRRAVARGAA